MKKAFLFLFLITLLLPLVSKGNEERFLYPRDEDIFYVAGITTPFKSMYQYKKILKDCLGEVDSFDCDFVPKIDLSNFKRNHNFYEILKEETSLLLIGEMHLDQYPKDFLERELRTLRDKYGYTTLALEMFNSSSQQKIDLYLKGKFSRRMLEKDLQEQWRYKTDYMNLIETAKKLGLMVIGVDDRSKNIHSLSEELRIRDIHWSNILVDHFKKNPNAKVALLCGKTHAFEKLSRFPIEIESVIESVSRQVNIKGQSFLVNSDKFPSYQSILIEKEDLPKGDFIYVAPEIAPYTSGVIFNN